MTTTLAPADVAPRLDAAVPGAVAAVTDAALVIDAAKLIPALTFLRDDDAFDLSFLSCLTAVDTETQLELVYHLQSLDLNHLLTVKAVAGGYDDPRLPSIEPLFRGALLQEREVFDLFGVTFEGHPDLRRIFLWDGFPGHPLRKAFLNMPGDLRAGLPGFSHESGANDWPVPGSVDERPRHPNLPAPGGAARALGAAPTGGEGAQS